MNLIQLASAPSDVVVNQKERWQDVVASDYPGIDKDIIDILDAINNFPGVATVFSCAGHIDEDKRKSKSQFYIRLIATEQGLEYISELYEWLIDEVRLQRTKRQLLEEKLVRGVTFKTYDREVLNDRFVRLTITQQDLDDDVCVPGIILSMGELRHKTHLNLAHNTMRNCLVEMKRARDKRTNEVVGWSQR